MAGITLSILQFNSASLVKSCFLIKTSFWGSFYKLHSLTMIKVFSLQSEMGSKFRVLQRFCNVYISGLFLTFFLSLSVHSIFFFFFAFCLQDLNGHSRGRSEHDWQSFKAHTHHEVIVNIVPAKPDESITLTQLETVMRHDTHKQMDVWAKGPAYGYTL